MTAKKPELEFTDFTEFDAESIGQVKGLSQRVISQIPGTEVATRILQFEPGTNTSSMGVQVHDFWEELYIIEGSIYDLELKENFSAGSVATRPPGMKHGPWKASETEGCKIFEVRYYAKGQ